MTPDTLTFSILKAPKKRLFKLFDKDPDTGELRKHNYDDVKFYAAKPVRKKGVYGLLELLQSLSDKPDCCVIRGAARPSVDVAQTVQRNKETFDDFPVSWVALDIDKQEVDFDWTQGSAEDYALALRAWLRGNAGAAFAGTDFVIQHTGSAGVKDTRLNVRLWFALSEPVTGAAWKQWYRGQPEKVRKAIDPATFSSVQIHYTARPQFKDGLFDPLEDWLVPRVELIETLERDTLDVSSLDVDPNLRHDELIDSLRGEHKPEMQIGLAGAFNRCFPITRCIDELVPDHFEDVADLKHLTLAGKSSGGGMFVPEGDNWLISNYAEHQEELKIKWCAYELVRWLKFDDNDEAMAQFCLGLEEVRLAEKELAGEVFGEEDIHTGDLESDKTTPAGQSLKKGWRWTDKMEVPAAMQPRHDRWGLIEMGSGIRYLMERGEDLLIYTRDDFLRATEDDNIPMDDGSVNAGKAWLRAPWKRRYKGIEYMPGFDGASRPGYFNTWRPGKLKPGNAKGRAANLFKQHIQFICDDEAQADHLLDYLAFTLQFPAIKINHAIVLGSQVEGVGKDMALQPVLEALGRHNVSMVHGSELETPYTGWYANAKLVVIQEVRHTNRFDITNKLKPYLTNPPETVTIYEKFQPRYELPNIANMIIMSNHADALAITSKDRRYYVIYARFIMRRDDAYYENLKTLFHQRADDILAMLLERDVSAFKPGAAPEQTDAHKEMVERSRSRLQDWLADELAAGNPLVDNDFVMVRNVVQEAERNKVPYSSPRYVGEALRDIGGMTKLPQRVRVDFGSATGVRKETVYTRLDPKDDPAQFDWRLKKWVLQQNRDSQWAEDDIETSSLGEVITLPDREQDGDLD